ncbi:MAG: hypothetical protein NVS3B26_24630 [Mycobacteriales bacterium]
MPAPVVATVTGLVSGWALASVSALPIIAPVGFVDVTCTPAPPRPVPVAGAPYVAVTDQPLVVPVVSATVIAVAPMLDDQEPGDVETARLAPVPVSTRVPAATVAVSVSVTDPVPAVLADAAPAVPSTTTRAPANIEVRRMNGP